MKQLDQDQQRRVADAPSAYRGIVRRAYDSSGDARNGRANAVRAFCLQCVGYVRKDVAHCTATACPLWNYRPYQSDDEPDDGDSSLAANEIGPQNAPGGTGG